MTVHISHLDDLGMPSWAHGVIGVATGGLSLTWDKKARNAVGGAMVKAGRATGKVLEKAVNKVVRPTVCSVGGAIKDDKSVYGAAARVATGVLCPKEKKVEVEKPRGWYENPLAVGAVAAGAGLLLGALFSSR